ncbi:Calcium ATPase, partial [Pseudohyphozyma bogoriensis]
MSTSKPKRVVDRPAFTIDKSDYQGGHYDLGERCYGYLLDGFPSPMDSCTAGGRVIISHGGGCSDISDIDGYQLRTDQSSDNVRVRALINCHKERVPVVLIAGAQYEHFRWLGERKVSQGTPWFENVIGPLGTTASIKALDQVDEGRVELSGATLRSESRDIPLATIAREPTSSSSSSLSTSSASGIDVNSVKAPSPSTTATSVELSSPLPQKRRCTFCHAEAAPIYEEEINCYNELCPEFFKLRGLVPSTSVLRVRSERKTPVSKGVAFSSISVAGYSGYTFVLGENARVHHLWKADTTEADGFFEQYQEEEVTGLLKRNHLIANRLPGGYLCSNFSFNAGVHYRHVVDVRSLPFEESPPVLASVCSHLSRAAKAVTRASDIEFNELLTVAYLQGGKMNFHDDGERGLGPVVATLSLGSQASMAFRKKKFRAPEGSELQSTPPSPPLLTITLLHGDVAIMEGADVQSYYELLLSLAYVLYPTIPVNRQSAMSSPLSPQRHRTLERTNSVSILSGPTRVEPRHKIPIGFRTLSIEVSHSRGGLAGPTSGTMTVKDLAALEWHTLDPDEVCSRLGVSPAVGLDKEMAARRLQKDGKNAISPPPKNLPRKIFFYIFGGFGSLLFGASIICFIA